jgi:hypothetical protein
MRCQSLVPEAVSLASILLCDAGSPSYAHHVLIQVIAAAGHCIVSAGHAIVEPWVIQLASIGSGRGCLMRRTQENDFRACKTRRCRKSGSVFPLHCPRPRMTRASCKRAWGTRFRKGRPNRPILQVINSVIFARASKKACYAAERDRQEACSDALADDRALQTLPTYVSKI